MVEVLRFKAEHVSLINQQSHDEQTLSGLNVESYRFAEKQEHSYTIAINGIVQACFGAIVLWKNRAEAWAIIDKNCGKHFVSIVRVMKRTIDLYGYNRTEAVVQSDFEQGHRLVKLLGFDLEAPLMRKYGVTGLDYSLYARVK